MVVKRRVLFLRPTMGTGGADRVTLQILKALDRGQFHAELALMRAEGVFLNDVPVDIPIHDCKAPNLIRLVPPLKKIILLGKYDFVYSTSSGTNIPAIIAARRANFGGKVIISQRTSLVRPSRAKLKAQLIFMLQKHYYPKAAHITAVSRAIVDDIGERMRIPHARLHVVRNPIVDDDLLGLSNEPLTCDLIDKNIPTILAAGRFEPQKDYDVLLRSFAQVRQRIPCRLIILGTGPLLDHCKQLSRELGIVQDVYFPGFEKNPFKYMRHCTVFALSSKQEGMPGVLIQALALGAPCVATDCPTGPNELIRDGWNGFLVPVGDYERMAERILTLIGNAELRANFSSNGPPSVDIFETQKALSTYFDFL
jgi:glycosyltransferase involved in cell wall biosynthesis